MKKITLLLALLLLLTSTLVAQHSTERQQTGSERSLPEYLGIMEDERRVSGLQIERVITTLKVEPNTKIADIGAGSGLFTRPLARRTGSAGVVYAVEVRRDLVEYLKQKARAERLGNVRVVLGAKDDPRLPEPVDLIVIIDTLHHIEVKLAYLKKLSSRLRPSGRIAVIDFKEEQFPANHDEMRYTLADLDSWMRAAGLQRAESHDFLESNFFVVYRR